jgi:hypothetical protein
MDETTQPLGRDQRHATIERKYELIYGAIARALAHAAKSSSVNPVETHQLMKTRTARIWSLMSWMLQPNIGQRSDTEQAEYIRTISLEQVAWHERGERKFAFRDDWEIASGKFYAESIAQYVPAACDLVIDLGCGWGHRMIDLHLAGINARFVGGDRSDHSRDATLSATSLFPAMQAKWFKFDFQEPDFSPLPDAKSICIFTCHAIEQVDIVGSGFVDKLLARYPHAEIVGVHLEPISFQIDTSRLADLTYARKKLYNMDLYEVIRAHPRLEIIATEAALVDIEGDANTTALLAWKACR